MIALIQRVRSASVEVNGSTVAAIDQGLLALIGIEKNDQPQQCTRMLQRLLGYRVFADDQGRMNLGLQAIGGGLLLVPQFTLVADTSSGMRPGFSSAASPEHGRSIFEHMCKIASQAYPHVSYGVFSADMQVHLINDGPVTFNLRVAPVSSVKRLQVTEK